MGTHHYVYMPHFGDVGAISEASSPRAGRSSQVRSQALDKEAGFVMSLLCVYIEPPAYARRFRIPLFVGRPLLCSMHLVVCDPFAFT